MESPNEMALFYFYGRPIDLGLSESRLKTDSGGVVIGFYSQLKHGQEPKLLILPPPLPPFPTDRKSVV